MATDTAPLSGLRVLEIAGEFIEPVGRHLVDLGADVTLVEPPGGSPSRHIAPQPSRPTTEPRSLYFLRFNLGKRSVVLDLDTEEGLSALRGSLLPNADVLMTSFNQQELESHGLDYVSLTAINPNIILTTVTPYGRKGIHAGFAGNDFTAGAAGGMTFMEGRRDGLPAAQPHYQGVQMTALHAAYGTLLAWWHVRNGGGGQEVDVSLQDVVAHEYFNFVYYASYGEIVQRVGGLSGGRPTNYFPCSDGWILMSLIQAHQWEAFAEWTQDPLIMDPMFDDSAVRADAVEFLDERISEFTRSMTVQEFLEGSIPRRIPAGPVNDIVGLINHPHTIARNVMTEVDDPVIGTYSTQGAPFRFSRTPWEIKGPAPTIGQHNDDLAAITPRPHENGHVTTAATPTHERALPLEGIRVVDLTKSWAGPYGARYLADFGAEVIRIESTKFPEGRVMDPDNHDAWLRSNTMYGEINRNKYSVALDLHSEEGKDIFRRLVAESDIVLENFHYATLPRWGMAYEDLKKVNSRIIVLSAPGYGYEGPIRDYFAYGGCIGAYAGISTLWGHAGSEVNERPKQAYTDFVTAGHLALSVMAALHERERSGEGQHIELTQIDSAVAMVGTAILEHTINGETPQPIGNRSPHAAPQGVYASIGVDKWVAISCETDEEWQTLATLMGGALPAELREKCTTLESRHALHDEIDAAIGEWASGRTPGQIMQACQKVGVKAAIVASGEDLYHDPHLRSRGYVVEIDHPWPGKLQHPGMTVRLTETPGQVRMPAPLTGQHTAAIVERVLGIKSDEAEELTKAGVLV